MGYENPRAALAGLTRELTYERARKRTKRAKTIEAEIAKVKAQLGIADEPETAVVGEALEMATSAKSAKRVRPKGGSS